MEQTEIRAVIKYFFIKGLSSKDIKSELDNTLGDSSPSYTTIKTWVADFKRGRKSTEDAPRSGRPKTATCKEIVEKVHKIVLNDRRSKLVEIAEAVGISTERVHYILTEVLDMRKLSARWVPRLLTPEQKLIRKMISEECLARLQHNPVDFLRRFITVDETWIHHYSPETKQQSKQWTAKGEPVPKKAKTVRSAGKVMASVFWDAKGILFIDYLEKGKTINGPYYASLLDQLKQKIQEKRPGLVKKKILFHQDNAPCHKSVIAMEKINELGFELVPHAPYSPDLAPSDFSLFPNLKKFHAGKKYGSDSEVIAATNAYFDELDEKDYRDGIKGLEHRWTKCIQLEGDYVEK